MEEMKKESAKERYDKRTAKYYSLKLNQKTDKKLIDHVAKQSNIQGYFKGLIKKDIQQSKENK